MHSGPIWNACEIALEDMTTEQGGNASNGPTSNPKSAEMRSRNLFEKRAPISGRGHPAEGHKSLSCARQHGKGAGSRCFANSKGKVRFAVFGLYVCVDSVCSVSFTSSE